MKLSEYIGALQALKDAYGDLDVETYVFGRRPAYTPRLEYRKILKGRETRREFWGEWHGEDRKGEPVIRV